MDTDTSKGRNTGKIMRGLAILCVASHNYLRKCGYAAVNEHDYIEQRNIDLLNGLATDSICHSLVNCFSFTFCFFVFVFLSGYGLEQKYGNSNPAIGRFIWKQWKKLVWLMLPGLLFFLLLYIDDMNRVIGSVLGILMIDNFFILRYMPGTGVYWYLGLAFQLYILWVIMHRLDDKWLIAIGALFVVIQLLFINSPWLKWIRFNSTGWMNIMILGMIAGRHKTELNLKWGWLLLIAAVALAIYFASFFNIWSWLLVLPLAGLAFFWAAAELLNRWGVSRRVMLWFGGLSGFIYICHPVVREIMLSLSLFTDMDILIKHTLYIIFSIGLAWCYKRLRDRLPWLLRLLLAFFRHPQSQGRF